MVPWPTRLRSASCVEATIPDLNQPGGRIHPSVDVKLWIVVSVPAAFNLNTVHPWSSHLGRAVQVAGGSLDHATIRAPFPRLEAAHCGQRPGPVHREHRPAPAVAA